MSKTFFISDTHFWHKNVISFERRPYETVEEMNEKMIENWNNTVSDDDVVYHLGDFGIGNIDKSIEILKRLNGKILLIKGNHDHTKNIKKMTPYLDEYLNAGHYLKSHKYQFYLSHFPMQIGNRPRIFNLHGHIHSHPSTELTQFNVGVDSMLMRKVLSKDYGQPATIEEIVEVVDLINPTLEQLKSLSHNR